VAPNLSEIECNDSDDEIGDNQESDHSSGISDSEQSDRQAGPVVSGWDVVKSGLFISCPYQILWKYFMQGTQDNLHNHVNFRSF
jgi:hypothetical protein